MTVWEKISSHAANHLLDCETNNSLAAEILGVRYLMEAKPQTSAEQNEEQPKEKDWLGLDDNWL